MQSRSNIPGLHKTPPSKIILKRDANTPRAEMLDLRREIVLEVREGMINEKDRTVPLSFCSEAPYERWFGWETLDCSPGAVILNRLNNGGALLKDHNRELQTGVVVRGTAKMENKKGVCEVKFSRSEIGEAEMQDVKDGIRTLVSVGYIVHEMVLEKEIDGVQYFRVTKWEPYEVSIVSIPADTTVGIGKIDGQTLDTKEKINSMLRKFYPHLLRDSGGAPDTRGGATTTAPAPAPTQTRSVEPGDNTQRDAILKLERDRVKNIRAVADRVNTTEVRTFAQKAIDDGMTVDAFNHEVLTKHFNAKPIETHNPEIGASEGEIRRFSLVKAINDIASGGALDGLEKEMCEAAEKKIRRSVNPKGNKQGFIMPEEVSRYHAAQSLARMLEAMFTRTQNATTATAGGHLVQTQYGPLIEFLRNKTVLGQLGITIIDGLVGNFLMPQQTGGATAYWVSETGELTDSEGTFAQKAMTPHRLGATIPFSTQLLAQSSISVDDWVRNELRTACALKKDLAGLEGTGVDGQPLGIKNTPGINATVTYGGAPAWADVVEHETGITVDNADIGSMGFALSAAAVGKWKTTLKDSVAGAGYLIEGGGDMMSANGYPVKRTNQISGSISFFGVWAQLILAQWAGTEIIVDPYALKKKGQIEVTQNELCDFLGRQPLAFNISTDSAAQ